MSNKKYILYKHTTPAGKIYVGITSLSPQKRWGTNGSRYRKDSHFGLAIQKYGWDNITHEILFQDLSKEDACQKEKEYIAKYQSNNPDHGYNMTSGGESGFEYCESTKMKLVISGKLHYEERREKLLSGLLASWEKPEYREKMCAVSSEAGKKNKGRPAHNKGIPMSEEVRKKISESKRGQHWSLSEETKAKMRKPKSEETRRKMSEAKKKMFAEMTPEERCEYSVRKRQEYYNNVKSAV